MAAKTQVKLWGIAFLLSLALVIFFLHSLVERQNPAVVAPVPTQPESLKEEPVSGGQDMLNPETLPAVSTPEALIPAQPPSAAFDPSTDFMSPQAPPVASSAGSIGAQPGAAAGASTQQAPSGLGDADIVSANAPMTDSQIMERVELENQKQEKIEEIIAARDRQAEAVLRSALAAEGSPAQEQQVIPSNFTREDPPDAIIRKLKSHQLVAH